MSWFRIQLTNDQVVAGEHMKIQDEFSAAWTAALAPKRAAMFGADHPAEDYFLYFSPEAASLAAALIQSRGGTSCQPPPQAGTSLLVGHRGVERDLLR